MMDSLDFIMLLFLSGVFFILLFSLGLPSLMDSCISEDATWEFHNSVVQDKFIIEKKGFPFGSTEYFVKIDNHTIKVQEHSIFLSIIPNETSLGYWVNKDTGELTIYRHT